MTVQLAAGLGEAPPLDPHEARAKLMLAVWLLAELGATRRSAGHDQPGRPAPRRRETPSGRAVRRRGPVRPPRAC
jgi:hypothetical protein